MKVNIFNINYWKPFARLAYDLHTEFSKQSAPVLWKPDGLPATLFTFLSQESIEPSRSIGAQPIGVKYLANVFHPSGAGKDLTKDMRPRPLVRDDHSDLHLVPPVGNAARPEVICQLP